MSLQAKKRGAYDSRHFETILDDWNTSAEVYADSGYPSQEREGQLKASGYRSRIQRKGSRNHPLPECQQRRNHKIPRVRARVEHVLGAMEQMGGKSIQTIGHVWGDFVLAMMAKLGNVFWHRKVG